MSPTFSSLSIRNYRIYATGAFVSNIGTWMESIALGIYVTEATDQAAWTGTVAAAAFVPIAFFGPLGGALADRFPRKWLLLTTTFVQVGLAVSLLDVQLQLTAAIIALAFYTWAGAADALRGDATGRSVALEFGSLVLIGLVAGLLLHRP